MLGPCAKRTRADPSREMTMSAKVQALQDYSTTEEMRQRMATMGDSA